MGMGSGNVTVVHPLATAIRTPKASVQGDMARNIDCGLETCEDIMQINRMKQME
jgi:hypothetical protein